MICAYQQTTIPPLNNSHNSYEFCYMDLLRLKMLLCTIKRLLLMVLQ